MLDWILSCKKKQSYHDDDGGDDVQRPHLVILVMDHLSDEGLGLVGPGLSAGLAGGGPVG